MIKVGEVSSVSWDVYIVTKEYVLTKGGVEEKHSEDREWANYLGKDEYFLLSDLAQHL